MLGERETASDNRSNQQRKGPENINTLRRYCENSNAQQHENYIARQQQFIRYNPWNFLCSPSSVQGPLTVGESSRYAVFRKLYHILCYSKQYRALPVCIGGGYTF